LGSQTISATADKSPGLHTVTSPTPTIPNAGSQCLFAVLDSANVIPESNETNNAFVTSTPVNVTGSAAGSTNVIIDNGQSGYAETGSGWLTASVGYNNNQRYHPTSTVAATASWQLSNLSTGTYTLAADWNAYYNHATNVTYQIYDGNGTLLATSTVNQQTAPTGTAINGVTFQNLATVTLSSPGSLKVVLSDNANG
jgi:hypothetical protein